MTTWDYFYSNINTKKLLKLINETKYFPEIRSTAYKPHRVWTKGEFSKNHEIP